MISSFNTQTVLDAVLRERGMSSADTDMNELPARWSAVASHLSSFIQCVENPLDCYKLMIKVVQDNPRFIDAEGATCDACASFSVAHFYLCDCQHKLCRDCFEDMINQLSDECKVCAVPIRELAFYEYKSSVTPPIETKEPCPVFANLLKRSGLPPETSAIVHGFKKNVQLNLLEDRHISSPPKGQTSIPEEDLLYLRDYMKVQFLHFYEEVDAMESVSCSWKGTNASEHQLECPLREDVCKNKVLGCNFAGPCTIVAYHGINCENVCLYEPQLCPLCNKSMMAKDIYAHEISCSKMLIAEHREKLKREYEAKNSPMKTTSSQNMDVGSIPAGVQSPEKKSDADLKGITVQDVYENANLLGEMYCDLVPASQRELHSSTSSAIASSTDPKQSADFVPEITEIVAVVSEDAARADRGSVDGKKTGKSKALQKKGKSSAKVLSYDVCTSGSGHPFIVYKIELATMDGSEPIIVQKRMKEIKLLHRKLQHSFPSVVLPKLPQDRPWALGGNRLKFVQQRVKLLEAYCSAINSNVMIYKSKIYKDYTQEKCTYTPVEYALKE